MPRTALTAGGRPTRISASRSSRRSPASSQPPAPRSPQPMLPERRHDISRLEAFSDAVFAFALTLLVVSLEVPKSFDELMNLMRGFPAFACCFAVLVGIWVEHNLFFRRYGLDDGYTVLLNSILLFVVMFY